eukprot:2927326-Alexandrium_andersonii.AAC.1
MPPSASDGERGGGKDWGDQRLEAPWPQLRRARVAPKTPRLTEPPGRGYRWSRRLEPKGLQVTN